MVGLDSPSVVSIELALASFGASTASSVVLPTLPVDVVVEVVFTVVSSPLAVADDVPVVPIALDSDFGSATPTPAPVPWGEVSERS